MPRHPVLKLAMPALEYVTCAGPPVSQVELVLRDDPLFDFPLTEEAVAEHLGLESSNIKAALGLTGED